MKKTLLLLLILFPFSIFAQGTWTQKANFGGTPRREAVGFSIGTKGYIGTGFEMIGFNVVMHKDFWEYDPVTDSWTQKADFAGTGRICAAGFSIGTKGYIGTGADDSIGRRDDFYEYDPALNAWAQKANFAGGARFYAVGFSIGSKGYIGTGDAVPGGNLADFWEYDPGTDAWVQKANIIGLSRQHAIGFSIGAKGYLGTGNDTTLLFNDFYEYDPATDVWIAKASFPGNPSEGGATFTIGAKGYVATGYDNSFMIDLWEYDPSVNSWAQKANFPAGGRHGAVGFSIGAKGYVGTGNNNLTLYKDFWEYDPGVIGMDENQTQLSHSIFPNPFIESATLTIHNENSSGGLIELFDLHGKIVKQLRFTGNSALIARDDLPAGIYLYVISSPDKIIASGKLMAE